MRVEVEHDGLLHEAVLGVDLGGDLVEVLVQALLDVQRGRGD